jgi:G3E family GTPase
MTRLDSIVTMVDCENFSLDLFNSEAAQSQISYGDIIVLNKTDLVDEGDVDALEIRIRDMKDSARILRTTKAEVPLPLVLSVGLFESDQYFKTEEVKDEHHDHDHAQEHDHECAPDCGHDHHHHDHEHHDHSHVAIETLALELAGDFCRVALEQQLLQLVIDSALIRLKGRLWLSGKNRPLQIQAVGPRLECWFEPGAGQASISQQAPGLELVLLGFQLDRPAIESCLNQALTGELAAAN